MTKSKLLNYIGHLLDSSNDSALRAFVVDPISEAEEAGLTKAERAVLRRTVAGLSNNSVNGYSIDRSLSSYRRSLRLLQNVLHHTGNKVAQSHHESLGDDTYGLVLYHPNIVEDNDYTCKDNAYLQDNAGGPFLNPQSFHASFSQGTTVTVGMVMEQLQTAQQILFETDPSGAVVQAFNINGTAIRANIFDPSTGELNPCYELTDPPTNHNVFWFFSIDGNALNPANAPVGGTVSFANYVLEPNQVVYWQLFAPDTAYGYLPCKPHNQNKFGKAKAKAMRAS